MCRPERKAELAATFAASVYSMQYVSIFSQIYTTATLGCIMYYVLEHYPSIFQDPGNEAVLISLSGYSGIQLIINLISSL